MTWMRCALTTAFGLQAAGWAGVEWRLLCPPQDRTLGLRSPFFLLKPPQMTAVPFVRP